MKFDGTQPGDNEHVGPRELLDTLEDDFDETPNAQRPEFAARWLGNYLSKTHRSAQASDVISNYLAPSRGLVRRLILTIPRGHPVFTPMQCTERNATDTELRHFFNWGVSLSGLFPHTSPSTELVRRMWLEPELPDRISAMMELATSRATAGMNTRLETVMRDLAWDITEATGMDDTAVLAATRLTLAVHRDGAGIGSEHAIVRAIAVLLARCEYGAGLYQTVMSERDVRATIAARPTTCIETLEFIYASSKYGVPLTDSGEQRDARCAATLAVWLPAHHSQILVLDSLSVAPLDILRQLKASDSMPRSFDLPPLTSGDTV